MRLSMAPLLMHSEHVPAGARDALKSAYAGPPEDRQEKLESAARILHAETDLDCRDVRELLALSSEGCPEV